MTLDKKTQREFLMVMGRNDFEKGIPLFNELYRMDVDIRKAKNPLVNYEMSRFFEIINRVVDDDGHYKSLVRKIPKAYKNIF